MTDNEIIKALECCSSDEVGLCRICPLDGECFGDINVLLKYALDLINRLEAKVDFMTEQRDIYMQDATELSQKVDKLEAENKRLQTDNSSMQSTLAKMSMGVEQARAEAVKEFADFLISKCDAPYWCVWMSEIEDYAKERVGDAE